MILSLSHINNISLPSKKELFDKQSKLMYYVEV